MVGGEFDWAGVDRAEKRLAEGDFGHDGGNLKICLPVRTMSRLFCFRFTRFELSMKDNVALFLFWQLTMTLWCCDAPALQPAA